jgi:hypothetical protein
LLAPAQRPILPRAVVHAACKVLAFEQPLMLFRTVGRIGVGDAIAVAAIEQAREALRIVPLLNSEWALSA